MKENLTLSKKEMRELGYKAIDIIIEHLIDLNEKPVTRTKSRQELEQIFREKLPETGVEGKKLFEFLQNNVFENIMHVDHPKFLAFVPNPNNFLSALGDLFASAFNIFAGTWLESSSAAQIELVTLDWMKNLFGLPENSGGIFVSGGSMANLMALVVARSVHMEHFTEQTPKFYYSTQTHSSIDKALRILGFTQENIVKIPVNDKYQMDTENLEKQLEVDVSINQVPICIIATAGTTNTGSVDPLDKIAEIARKYNVWLHVDGAYGLAAILDEREKDKFTGLELADSITFDPHKWWFQPYEISGLLVRDANLLRNTFHILPEYLKDIQRELEEVNFCDYGPQLTRSFRALKFWLSLKYFGISEFRKCVKIGIDNAAYVENLIKEQYHSVLQVVSPSNLAIICFRYIRSSLDDSIINRLNGQIVQEMIQSQFAMISSTNLNGIICLRFCTINPRTTQTDLANTLKKIVEIGEKIEIT
jgi:aromatic-L-amino-acid/L-tryptophan decarboxylase